MRCDSFPLPPGFSLKARTEYLRGKSRAALEHAAGPGDEGEARGDAGGTEHLNLFPLEDSSEKKGNAEYLREKKDEKVRRVKDTAHHVTQNTRGDCQGRLVRPFNTENLLHIDDGARCYVLPSYRGIMLKSDFYKGANNPLFTLPQYGGSNCDYFTVRYPAQFLAS